MAKTTPVCRDCGSENVTVDGVAEWNSETQDWELKSTYDSGNCLDCGAETKWFDWKDNNDTSGSPDRTGEIVQ